MAYARRVKEAAIRMMIPPESKPLTKINEIMGIPLGTLKKWQKELRASGHAAPANDDPADQWNSNDKVSDRCRDDQPQ